MTTDKCKHGHKILGLHCVDCGWRMQILNVYVPTGKRATKAFLQEVKEFLDEKTIIVLVEDSEIPTICEVGFQLDMHDKLYLTSQLSNTLVDR